MTQWVWEQWHGNIFDGVYGMVIDDHGNQLQAAALLTQAHHLHRGDDAFFLDGCAAWMTGNEDTKDLYIHFFDDMLNYEMVTVE